MQKNNRDHIICGASSFNAEKSKRYYSNKFEKQNRTNLSSYVSHKGLGFSLKNLSIFSDGSECSLIFDHISETDSFSGGFKNLRCGISSAKQLFLSMTHCMKCS